MSSETSVAPNTNWVKTVACPLNPTLEYVMEPTAATAFANAGSIVAVHGMNVWDTETHADNTWTHKESQTNWLRDLLPLQIPDARILAYQYNANILMQSSCAGIEEQALNLLNWLWQLRKGIASRPIIFIAHSLGGILVKEALATAKHGDGAYASIWCFTYGIAFFGTPHQGSMHANWAEIAASIATVLWGNPDNTFLASVMKDSSYNEKLAKRFKPMLDSYRFLSVCETLPNQKYGFDMGVIVYPESAILGLPDTREIKIYLNRNHTSVCKFANAEEKEWKQVSNNLCHMARSAVDSFNYTPTASERKKMFKNLSWHPQDNDDEAFSLSVEVANSENLLSAFRESSPESRKLENIRVEVSALNSQWEAALIWLSAILTPLMGLVGAIGLLGLSLGILHRSLVQSRIEDARKTRKLVLDLERLSVEQLDAQLHATLAAKKRLQQASRQLSINQIPQTQGNADANDEIDSSTSARLENDLDELAVGIATELHLRGNAAEAANVQFQRTEEFCQEAQNADDSSYWKMLLDCLWPS